MSHIKQWHCQIQRDGSESEPLSRIQQQVCGESSLNEQKLLCDLTVWLFGEWCVQSCLVGKYHQHTELLMPTFVTIATENPLKICSPANNSSGTFVLDLIEKQICFDCSLVICLAAQKPALAQLKATRLHRQKQKFYLTEWAVGLLLPWFLRNILYQSIHIYQLCNKLQPGFKNTVLPLEKTHKCFTSCLNHFTPPPAPPFVFVCFHIAFNVHNVNPFNHYSSEEDFLWQLCRFNLT